MKFLIFFICMPLVYSEPHTFITFYTEISGKTTAGIPEFFAVTTLDDQQMDYYDSNIMELIPKQDWMKEFTPELWKKYTEIREHVQQIFKNNIHDLMKQFNQSHGLHTYQRMYRCDWDDQTEETQGFDHHGYDGEDFISLDLKEFRYITSVQQGVQTMQKWNNDRSQLFLLKQYFDYECVYWLKEFLRKADLKRTAPQVFLLQKHPSSPLVMCHVTGFYPSGVTITWLRNGLDHHKDVDLGDLLPNEDETFQKTSYLHVHPDEWKKNQYTCEVEHMGETIRKILTEDEIKTNYRPPPWWRKLFFPSAASDFSRTYRNTHALLCVMGGFMFVL
ncbi:major histocompatibility complex class I-related gene protein-like [Chanodichthys erythropterus]|uniref:major histocompatibility complex class I-related gene protein-like n=1 Tax=Chanodichthys erythropterus TaxID=933992 RepID=UPI00351EFDB9